MAALSAMFRGNSLKPAWEYQPGGIIWRILFSSQNLIAGEARNQDIKSTGFFCVDANTGKPLWEGIEFDEPWWIGIEAVYDKWIILHRFARPDMPEHRGIYVAGLAEGKLKWKNDELAYWFVCDQKIYAYKFVFEKRIGFEIDIVTGTILNEYAGNLHELHELRRKASQRESESLQGVLFPELFSRASVDSGTAVIIRQITGEHAIESRIEYLLRNSILIVSYHRKNDTSPAAVLENILTVYDTEYKEIKFNEIIAKGIQFPSLDTFFAKDEFVFFLKDKIKLTALKIWKS